MKFKRLIVLIGLAMLPMTGCTSMSESPEQLIKDKPIYNENNKLLYDRLNKIIMNPYTMIMPSNSKDVGKINKLDLDADNVNEIIAFQGCKTNYNSEEPEVGFVILTENKDGTYTEKEKILEIGSKIEYANFYDLDNDGKKEILMAIKNNDKTLLYLYKYNNGQIEDSYKLEPTWLNRSMLSDMKIEVGYFDDDYILDILMLNFSSSNNTMYASIANLDSNSKSLVLKDYVKFENVKNINDLYITIGNLSTQVKGSSMRGAVLDIPISKEGNYLTQIIYLEDGKLKKAFKDDDKALMKSYYIPPEDINKDKVIDIPIINSRTVNENTYISKSSVNISWQRWNGKSDEESGLIFTSQVYYNYEYNFKFFIPNRLANKIYIKQEYDLENNNALFKFYTYDLDGVNSKNIFTITTASTVNLIEDTKGINLASKGDILLKETEKYNFFLTINDNEELKKLNITIEEFRNYFSLIYE